MQGRTLTLVFTFVLSLEMLATIAKADDIPSVAVPQGGTSPVITQPGTDTPQYFFKIACLNCQNGNQGVAAGRIRQSVVLLKEKAKHATKKGKKVLERSIDELESLAGRIEKGTVSSIKEVKATFARAQHALAYHYQQRAGESRLRKNFRQAGKELHAAANNIGFGLAWAGEGAQTKSREVIVATRDLGGSLAAGTKVNAKRVDAKIKALGLEIKRFGLKITKPIRR